MILLQFTSSSCNPCAILAKSMAAVGHPTNAYVEKISIDKHSAIATSLHIRTVPTLVLVTDMYDEVGRSTGVLTPKELAEWYKKVGIEFKQ